MTNSLDVRISADIADLNAKLALASAKVKDFGKDVRAVSDEIASQDWTDALANKLDQAQRGFLAAYDGVRKLGEFFEGTAEKAGLFATGNAKIARTMGISAAQAAGLTAALKSTGSSTEEYGQLAIALEERLRGQEAAFNSLGMKTRDANGRYLEGTALMDSAIATMREYRAGTDQNEVALELFGRRAADVYDVMRATPAVQAALAESLREVGVDMSDTSGRAREFEDEQAKLQGHFEALELALGQKITPALTSLDKSISTNASFWEGLGKIVMVVAGIVTESTEIMRDSFSSSGAAIEAGQASWIYAAGMIHAGWKANFTAMEEETKAFGQAIASIAQATGTDFAKTCSEIAQMLAALGSAKMPALPGAGDAQTDGNRQFVRSPSSDKAKEEAERMAQINKQTADLAIQSDEEANAHRLKMGEETAEAFKAQALELAQDRYSVDLQALEQEAASGKKSHAEYLAELARLDREHKNQVQKIDDEAADRQRAAEEKDFASFQKTQEEKVRAAIDANREMQKSGAIGAPAMQTEDIVAIDAAQAAVHRQFETLTKGWDQESEAYRNELDKRLEFDRWADDQRKHIQQETAAAEQQIWSQATRGIMQTEDTLVSDVLSKRRSLGADLLQMAGKFVEEEIASDLKLWTEKGLIALLGSDRIKATQQGGFLYNLLFNEKDVASTASAEAQKTAAVTAGVTARTGTEVAGASASSDASVKAGSISIMNDAYESAAHAFNAIMATVPAPANLVLAPVVAAATFAEVMAYDALQSFDVGAWELPHDMPAMLHKGEMVVPRDFASGLRGAGAGGGDGVTFNTHYYPTINMRDPASLKELLQKGGSELFDAVQRGYRLGLPMRPSMAATY